MAKGNKKARKVWKKTLKVLIQIIAGVITGTALLLIEKLLNGS